MNMHLMPTAQGRSVPPQGEERLLAWLGQLQSSASGSVEAEWFVAGMLAGTSSPRLRNAAALTLIDLKANAAGEAVLDVLRDPSLAPEAGTLLYALDELGVKLTIDVFLIVIEHGSFEARTMALSMIERRGLASVDAVELKPAIPRLEHFAGSETDPERAEAARVALDLLALAAHNEEHS